MSENVGTRSYQPRAHEARVVAMTSRIHMGDMIMGVLVALLLIAFVAGG
jgi:hypothetical protein